MIWLVCEKTYICITVIIVQKYTVSWRDEMHMWWSIARLTTQCCGCACRISHRTRPLTSSKSTSQKQQRTSRYLLSLLGGYYYRWQRAIGCALTCRSLPENYSLFIRLFDGKQTFKIRHAMSLCHSVAAAASAIRLGLTSPTPHFSPPPLSPLPRV